MKVERSGPGVDRVFGTCAEHGNYELPLGSIESGEIPRRCPACPEQLPAEPAQAGLSS